MEKPGNILKINNLTFGGESTIIKIKIFSKLKEVK
jgi:hypothetical protein